MLQAPLAGQGDAPEVAELRARIAVIRSELPQVTATAEKYARFLGYESTGRLLLPRHLDPPLYLEFLFRAGGPPDTQDTEGSDLPGLVLLPIRHWDGVGFGVATASERWQRMQRPVLIIGPANGRPSIAMGGSFLDDGAPDGSRAHAPINGIANMMVAWTFYSEVVGAATRAGWQPGVLLSVMAPGADALNANTRFRMPTGPPPLLPAGQLGSEYLDALDSALAFAARPAHLAAVQAVADRLNAARAAGQRIFVASCGHYLAEEIPADSANSPFIPIDFRKEISAELAQHRAVAHDMVVWIGYGGYDCPNAQVSGVFRALGLDVVLVTNMAPSPEPREVVANIPLSWQIPDAVATIPFTPGHLAPISSIEMALHYLWLRRLATITKREYLPREAGMRKSVVAALLFFARTPLAPAPAPAQGVPPEIAELRRRVAAIRADLPNVTAAADYATDFFTRDPGARFLFSATRCPGRAAEFAFHTGASPEMRDADDPAAHGVVIYPVAAWQSSGLTVAMLLEQWLGAGRPVIVIGSAEDRPTLSTLRKVITNGAPDGSRASAAINGVANMIAAWTLYVEFVASATRHQWQPGMYVSHLIPNADDSNRRTPFRVPTGWTPVAAVPAGQLGAEYLDRVDSLLASTLRPQHVALVERAADSLRAVRAAGHRVFVASCANYLHAYLLTDTIASPFVPWNGYEGATSDVLQRLQARANDGVLWFGYAGYDCPHVQPARSLQDAALRVVVVADLLPAQLPANVIMGVPLIATFPEHVTNVPYNREGAGSVKSIESALHYLWIRRLVAAP